MNQQQQHEERLDAIAQLMGEVRSHRFPTPREDIVQLKNIINTEIERRGNKMAAVIAIMSEQEVRMTRQSMTKVLTDLVGSLARQLASKQSKDEQLEQTILHHHRHHLCDDIRRHVNRASTKAAVESEREARMDSGIGRTYWTVDPDQIHQTKNQVNDLVARRGNQKASIEAMELEQAVRVAEHNMKTICEELIREVHRKNATNLVAAERTARITQHLFHDVCSEIRRSHNVKQAVIASETERIERIVDSSINAGGAVNTTTPEDPASLSNYYGPVRVSEGKESVNDAIRRLGNRNTAIESMRQEQHLRVLERTFQSTMEQLIRRVAQTAAKTAADGEKQRREALYRRHDLCSEIRSHTGRIAAAEAERAEQTARMDSGIGRTYWMCDSKTIADTKHAVNSEIEKIGNTAVAKEAAELEQHQRMVSDRMDTIREQLVSKVNQSKAREATELEQHQRVTRDHTHAVCEEIRRESNRKVAARTVDFEQTQRVAFGAIPPIGNGNKARVAMVHEIERIGNKRAALDSMEAERLNRMHTDQMHIICDAVRRFVAKRAAVRALDEAQQYEQARLQLRLVTTALLSEQNRKAARMAADLEQQRLMAEQPKPSTEFEERHARICRDVLNPTISSDWVRISPCA